MVRELPSKMSLCIAENSEGSPNVRTRALRCNVLAGIAISGRTGSPIVSFQDILYLSPNSFVLHSDIAERRMNFSKTLVLLFIILLALFSGSGCKSDSSTSTQVTITPITEDLFPLVAGHQFQYTGYLVDTNQVSTPLPNQPTPYKASWTLAPG